MEACVIEPHLDGRALADVVDTDVLFKLRVVDIDCREAPAPAAARREVVEVVTPGLAGDPEGIEAKRELALVAVAPGASCGLAILDATTGDFRATEVDAEDGAVRLPASIIEELERVEPREILLPASAGPEIEAQLGAALPDSARTRVAAESFDPAATASPEGLAQAAGYH